LAEYRKQYSAIRAASAEMAAISVDGPEKSEAVRDQLGLPFSILCDTERLVVREWSVYNAREKGGIAKPAVFIVEPGRIVRYVSVDEVASRVPASEIIGLLSVKGRISPAQRRTLIPRPGNFFSATRNSIRFGVRQPKNERSE
jgi:peroxiredoxin